MTNKSSTLPLYNQVALVTGGSGGLGRDIATRLSELGATVVVTACSQPEKADDLVKLLENNGGRAFAMPLDICNTTSRNDLVGGFRELLAELGDAGKFTILINNAGTGAHAPFSETSAEQLDDLFDVHVKGPFLLAQALLPDIQSGGRIINISSGLTRFALPGYAAYAAAKGAMEVATRYMAKELGNRGITVNSIAPGAIDNEFNEHAFNANPQIREFIASQTALGRVGQSDDIGRAVAQLCTDAGQWITAQRIEISGGMFL